MATRYRGWIYLFCFCCFPAFAQQNSPAKNSEAVTPVTTDTANRLITLDVVAADPSGHAIPGLQQQDFTLLDDKQPQKIISFQAVSATSTDGPSAEILLVIDEVNTSFRDTALARQQIAKLLSQNSGDLAWPVSIVSFSASGATETTPSRDRKTLIAQLDQSDHGLRGPTRAQGTYGALERLNLSLRTLGQLVDYEAKRPGRKLVIWISPGWTLLSTPRVELTSENQQELFRTIVGLSDGLRRARITLYNVNPVGSGGGVLKSYYKDFVKGVSAAKQVRIGNLALQVLAYQSGGLVLNTSNDLVGEIATCMNDANAYYVLSFEGAVGDGPNEYHGIEVKVDKPGLDVRTSSGYYAQPEQAHNH